MEFRVLGPVEIRVGERMLAAGHARQRAVLAALLFDLGRVVPAERLIDRVWGEDPPPTARATLQGYIARLRATLASDAGHGVTLSRRQGGYLLQADPDQLDLLRFRNLTAQAGTAADNDTAEWLLRQALALWHGPALAGAESPWLTTMRDTLELERHAARLDLNDISLRLGQHAALTPELISQAAANRGDERLIGQLMLALYRSGRQAEALRWFEKTRGHLADELGTDPALQLSELHQQILRADPALALTPPGAPGTPGAGATLAAGSPPATPMPRELPADVAAFTGRADELAELDQILLGGSGGAEHPMAAVISAVSGTAGVGKTALAVHWAHHAAAQFPDGQLYVNLRGYDPDQPITAAEALATFLRSLGVPGQDIPQQETERASRYRSLLAGKRMLILLDNAATVDQVRPLLPGHPECRALVTSRDALAGLVARDGAHRLNLDLLPRDDAVALLHELIGARATAEAAAVARLAKQCARLPLALRVAAELATARPATPVADLVTELEDEQRRLDQLDTSGDARTAVRAVFSWSYRSLNDDAARAFRLAGLHPGLDFDAYALTALTGSTLDQTRRELDVLVRAHLMQPGKPSRYGMHDLLRAYARELSESSDSEDGPSAATTRLFDYYLHTTANAMDILYPAESARRPRVPQPGVPFPWLANGEEAIAWLEAERSNLVAFGAHAAGNRWPGHATQLSEIVFNYLSRAGHHAEAFAICTHARSAARRTGDRDAEGTAESALGIIDWRQARYGSAITCFEQALRLFRDAGDNNRQARVLNNLGLVHYMLGAYERAAGLHRQALALHRLTADPKGEAIALNNLGYAELRQGHYQQAAAHLRDALMLAREAGDPACESMALNNLGDVELNQGRYESAAARQRQSITIAQATSNRAGEAYALTSLGDAELRLGRCQQAASHHRQALALFADAGERSGQAAALNGLGEAALASGRAGHAAAHHADALSIAAQIGERYQQARAYNGLGCAAHAASDDRGAVENLRHALALYAVLSVPEVGEVRVRLAALDSDSVDA
jgi:DNA-binding SARP family transcriptional activator